MFRCLFFNMTVIFFQSICSKKGKDLMAKTYLTDSFFCTFRQSQHKRMVWKLSNTQLNLKAYLNVEPTFEIATRKLSFAEGKNSLSKFDWINIFILIIPFHHKLEVYLEKKFRITWRLLNLKMRFSSKESAPVGLCKNNITLY